MRCENCGAEIDNMWGICPHCGAFTGGLKDSFSNIAKIFGGKALVRQEGDSFIVVLEIQGKRQAFKITPMDLDDVPYIPTESVKKPAKPKKKRVFDTTKEPETETNYVGNTLYIKVDLSGIDEEDIEIEKLENSVEVRAYKGKIRYFKLIPIPEDYKLISKEFLPGEVFVTLKKR
ncbi:MAG: hypothetical protein PVF58_17125 [Candidatus Methanofastidiosia archaeon]|jgi:hypothetical protein